MSGRMGPRYSRFFAPSCRGRPSPPLRDWRMSSRERSTSAVRHPPAAASAQAPPPVPAVSYPANLQVERQPEYDKFRALIRSPYAFVLNIINALVLLPHAICLLVLGVVAIVIYLISCFAVLFTGRYPRGMWDFMVGVQRWSHRVAAWQFILSDAYPPFSFDPDAHPLRFDVQYPEEGVARWRGIPLLTGIMALPVTIVAEVVLILGYLLLVLPPFIPGFIQLAIIFTGKYPEGIFNFIRGGLRLYARGQAYATFLVTRYPPFELG